LPAVLASLPGEGEGEAPKWQGFLTLDLGVRGTILTEGTLGALGAKVRETRSGPGTKVKVAVVPELNVGELVLRNLHVRVGSEDRLGLGALEGVAVAVLPSKGVVKFAPAASADDLLAEVGT